MEKNCLVCKKYKSNNIICHYWYVIGNEEKTVICKRCFLRGFRHCSRNESINNNRYFNLKNEEERNFRCQKNIYAKALKDFNDLKN